MKITYGVCARDVPETSNQRPIRPFMEPPPLVLHTQHDIVTISNTPLLRHVLLRVTQGDKLKVFPSMTQYGWCFVVDLKDDTRRGWVPGRLKAAFFQKRFQKKMARPGLFWQRPGSCMSWVLYFVLRVLQQWCPSVTPCNTAWCRQLCHIQRAGPIFVSRRSAGRKIVERSCGREQPGRKPGESIGRTR